jgi:hypothetical protein
MFNDLQLFIDSVEYFLDFEFIIKKTKINGVNNFGAEITLFNINNINFKNFILKNNGLELLNGVVESFKTYKDTTSKYITYQLAEVQAEAEQQKQKEFLSNEYLFKNTDIANFFDIVGGKKIVLEKDIYFNKSDSLENRIKKIMDQVGEPVYFFDKKTNTIFFKQFAKKNQLLEIIDSSVTTNFKKFRNRGVEPTNEVVLRCKNNIFLTPLDNLEIEGVNYFITDITISGGTTSGVIMDVTASDLRDELEAEEE